MRYRLTEKGREALNTNYGWEDPYGDIPQSYYGWILMSRMISRPYSGTWLIRSMSKLGNADITKKTIDDLLFKEYIEIVEE